MPDGSKEAATRRGRGRANWLLAGVLLAVVAVGVGAWTLIDQDEEASDGPSVPDVTLSTFDDGSLHLTDYEGQPTVVNFFASWCPPCVAEMRDAFEPVHAELGGEVDFLGVATQDDRQAALNVVDVTGVTYDLAEDPDGALFRALGATSMPATFYIDGGGHVVGAHMGALTRAQLRGQLESHLDVGGTLDGERRPG